MIYAKGYGLADIEQNVSITPQSVFDIGSTSKQFSSASILLLERQGKLSVNDDVRKYVPELPDYGKKITILHLLNHTSGLRDYLALMELGGINTDSVTTDDDAMAFITRQKGLNFEPGSDWLYSNTGFFLLSIIVKRVNGKTLRDFAAENIFSPLGMTHTQYRDDHTVLIPNRALAYEQGEKGGYKLDVSYFEQTGDGAVHTSVEDLLKWDENFYSAQIGGRDLLMEMQERGKLNSGKTLDYAKGLFIGEYRGQHTVSHNGSWGGYRAELLRFPHQHLSVACLCNVGNADPSKRAKTVAEIFLGDLLGPAEKEKQTSPAGKTKPEIPLTSQQLKSYSGTFVSEELGVSYILEVNKEKLIVKSISRGDGVERTGIFPSNELRATAADEFEISEVPITIHFKRDAEKAVSGFTLDAGRTKGILFLRVFEGML
jgi:CubicO group peptidase (beta-lactamase class C family)